MELYSLIIGNKWILELAYALIIPLICMIIVLKTDRFYKLSLHTGIRYFRNAFFFYGLAFPVRYIFGLFADFSIIYNPIFQVLFEYLLIMAGFFLLYSLIWRRFESGNIEYFSSLINKKVLVFHLIALVLAFFDAVWATYQFMFVSQILIFIFTVFISLFNYIRSGKQHKFLKFSFIGMVLGLAVWVLNALIALCLEWDKRILINIGIINVIFFLLFLCGVIRFTRRK